MTVLITGAAGFIGHALAERLTAEGTDVIGVDNFSPYYDVQLKRDRARRLLAGSRFKLVELDIADAAALEQAFDRGRVTSVVNLAAQVGVRYSLVDPASYVSGNLLGFGNVLTSCQRRGVQHLVFASSSSVYGIHSRLPFIESDHVSHPASLYGATKACNELLAHSYSYVHGLPCTGLRFFTVYGPWGRPDMALFDFTSRILAGKPVRLHNHGDMQRDFTYVADVVETIVRILRKPPTENRHWHPDDPDPGSSSAPYEIFNVASGRPVELRRYLDVLQTALGREAVIEPVEMEPGELVVTHASTAKLEAWIRYRPTTPLEEGVSAFVDWYRAYYD